MFYSSIYDNGVARCALASSPARHDKDGFPAVGRGKRRLLWPRGQLFCLRQRREHLGRCVETASCLQPSRPRLGAGASLRLASEAAWRSSSASHSRWCHEWHQMRAH